MTNEPVEFYVDMNTRDTIYGRGRYVVNNYIVRSNDGMYRLDASKIKMDKDDIKIKDGSKKLKMDGSKMKSKGTSEGEDKSGYYQWKNEGEDKAIMAGTYCCGFSTSFAAHNNCLL